MAPDEKARYQARKKREQLVRRMGIDPDNGWQVATKFFRERRRWSASLRSSQKQRRYLSGNRFGPRGRGDRWHLQEAIGGDTSRYHRVVFNEITQKAIQAAFEAPGELDTRACTLSRRDVSGSRCRL